MTIADLFASEELRQYEFPVARQKVFLAHAGVCPLPPRVAGAMGHYLAQITADDQEEALPVSFFLETRALAARLLHAQAEEIAFVGPTSLALSYIASGLSFNQGDNVLIHPNAYPANVYPLMALAEKGVQVRFLDVREIGLIRLADVQRRVDDQTRLVALASCHFVSGYRTDLNAIGQALHQRNILFCVDAIQTLGAFPTTVEHVDFLAADAHKWLLGPCAAGILYARKSLQERLRPTAFGWHNVYCPNYVAQEELVFRADARRYEAGSQNLLGLVGLNAAMELVLEIGIENIAAELLRKRALLVPALKNKGYCVLNAEAPLANASGIVTFYRDDVDMAPLYQKFEAADIITSLRSNRAGRKYLRLSPHFYNTDAELGRLLEML